MKFTSAKNKIESYKYLAQESQKAVVSWLSEKGSKAEICKQYWVLNGLFVKATPAIINELSQRPDVAKVYHDEVVSIVTPTENSYKALAKGVAWGVKKIEADKCWDAGYTGQGIIIGIIDTGVDSKHPALKDKWSGHWFVGDGMPPSEEPYDDNKHGTHCAGSILGGDGLGNFEEDIGVAPGAKYAAAKALNSGGSGSSNVLIASLQFMADLKSTVDIKAVSNSWAGNGGSDFYFEVIKTMRSLNIVPIFANGNNGSQGPGSVQSPGDYPNVIGVGATDSEDRIGSFSSLGPAPNKAPFNDRTIWYRGDWDFIKPNISAPGVAIHSSVPNGGYSSLNGTSMATPHLCGVVALLFQKNRNLTPEMVYNLLLDNADKPTGAGSYPNNTFGWGRVNALKSVQATPTMDQPWIYVSKKEMADLAPGKSVDLTITLSNLGGSDALNTTGKLVALDNYVWVEQTNYSFGNLKPKDEASNNSKPYKVFTHSLTPQGHQGRLGLILHADGAHDTLDYDDTVEISFVIGEAPKPHVIYEEDFEYSGSVDSFSLCWKTTGNWSRGVDVSHSNTHSVSSGEFTKSNSLELKNGIDLSAHHNPNLVLWGSDKVRWPEEWKKVEISLSTDGGNDWKKIFSYNGTKNSNTKWASHQVPLSDYTKKNVTLKFVAGGIGNVREATFWIDDICIEVPYDNAPPYFANTTLWGETYKTGPFEVKSTITDANNVAEANLYYRVKGGTWEKLTMKDQGNDLYSASIPAQNSNGKIDYYLEAVDTWHVGSANKGTFPIGAGQDKGFHSFVYGSTSIKNRAESITLSSLVSSIGSGLVRINYSLPSTMLVTIAVQDVRGRVVATLLDKEVKMGNHALQWNSMVQNSFASGLYFINMDVKDVKGAGAKTVVRKSNRVIIVK